MVKSDRIIPDTLWWAGSAGSVCGDGAGHPLLGSQKESETPQAQHHLHQCVAGSCLHAGRAGHHAHLWKSCGGQEQMCGWTTPSFHLMYVSLFQVSLLCPPSPSRWRMWWPAVRIFSCTSVSLCSVDLPSCETCSHQAHTGLRHVQDGSREDYELGGAVPGLGWHWEVAGATT